MPLIRIDAIECRSKEQVRGVLDAAHRAMLATFKVPQRDCYQIDATCTVWLLASGGMMQVPTAQSWTNVFSLAEFRAGMETPRRPTHER